MGSTYNPGQKSLGHYCNIHIFLSFLVSVLKQCILFEILLQFSLPPPYTKLKLRKNSGYTHPTSFVGWAEVLDLCGLENDPKMRKCPKSFVHDCSLVCHRNWSIDECCKSSTWRELDGIQFALQFFENHLTDQRVRWKTDNQKFVIIIQVGTMVNDLQDIGLKVFLLVFRRPNSTAYFLGASTTEF